MLILPAAIFNICVQEAGLFAPLETGGIFLGHRLPTGERQVQHMIGAGPKAKHRSTWLEVDDQWQNIEISRLAADDPNISYLGEWHTHPLASNGNISRVDRKALAQLAKFQDLRCPNPVMTILFRKRLEWMAAAWEPSQFRGRWWKFYEIEVEAVQILIA